MELSDKTLVGLLLSWSGVGKPINDIGEILTWIQEQNTNLKAKLEPCLLSSGQNWYYDAEESKITNINHSFFEIVGYRMHERNQIIEQPIINQNEVGYLGIIVKEINGILHFLMQAKIEPGNVNKVQISPTIQATKSNFTQKHGGKKPNYLDFFQEVEKYEVIFDIEQSEQSSRFIGKKNRNVMIKLSNIDDIEILPRFMWMTLNQIKQLMKYENLVNMDTRTVISCIPFFKLKDYHGEHANLLNNESSTISSILANSCHQEMEIELAKYKKSHKQDKKVIRLDQMKDWLVLDEGIICKKYYPFEVGYFDISIDDREVSRWIQPLFKAKGKALFGMLCKIVEGAYYFLITIKEEIGCLDIAEFGPTIQLEGSQDDTYTSSNDIETLFLHKLDCKEDIIINTTLSEEGGRFFCEQNRNVIINIKEEECSKLPKHYYWVSLATLMELNQKPNNLNIQLRNLISLLEI